MAPKADADGPLHKPPAEASAPPNVPAEAPAPPPLTAIDLLLCFCSVTATGTFQMTIFQVPSDATATLTIGGAAQNLTISTPGQHGKYSFNGTSGQKISLTLNFNSMTTCGTFSLSTASGTPVIADTHTCNNSFVATLPSTTTYNVPLAFDLGGSITKGTGTMSGSVANSP